ncbi:hypothetical protein [Methylobacterium komagatae]
MAISTKERVAEPAHTEPASEPEGPGALTAANILLPIEDFLSGDVLLLGSVAPGIRSRTSELAATLTVRSRMPSEVEPPDAYRGYDTIVAFDILAGTTVDGRHGSVPTDGSVLTRLRAIRQNLRPDGRLILALDHGAAEQDRAAAAQGSLWHPGHRASAWTHLRQTLTAVGLAHQHWWFPFPSHREARTILSEHGLSPHSGLDAGALAGEAVAARKAWRRIAEAGDLADRAPAALVLASAAPLPADHRLALHIGHERRPEFNKVATILARSEGPPMVLRSPRHPGLARHAAGITNRFPAEPLAPGRPWPEALEEILAHDGWTEADLAPWTDRWITALRAEFLGAGPSDPLPDIDTHLPGHAFDAVPRNLLVHGDRATFIDLEWELDAPLDFGHLLVRGLVDTVLTTPIAGWPAPESDPTYLTLLRAATACLGAPLSDAAIAERLDREARFQQIVSGRETNRNFAWLASTHPVPRAQLLMRARGLASEVKALRTERSDLVAAIDDARAQTDRVIAYAAERDRAVERLEAGLAEIEARLALPPPEPPRPAIRLGRAFRHLVSSKRT